MDISIIIVSWKVRDLLKKCLRSIEAARGDLALEIFVVDNDSQDGTVEMLKNEYGIFVVNSYKDIDTI